MTAPVARWSTPFQVSPASGGNIISIARLGGPGHAGEFVVIWEQSGDPSSLGDANGAGVYGQIFNEDGTKDGGPFLINATTSSEQVAPVVVERSSEPGFGVAFTDLSGANATSTDVRLRLFDDTGAPDGGEVIVGAGGATIGNIQNQPSVALGRDGGAIFVAYEDSGSIGAGEIRGQLFGNSGALAADFLITATAPPLGETDTHSQPNVTSIPNLGFVVTWVDNTESGLMFSGGTAIRGQLYSYTGIPVGAQFTVATATANTLMSFPKSASITATDNTFLVTWVQDDDAGAGLDYNVHARLFTTNVSGAVAGTEFVLSQTTADNQTQVAVAAYHDDQFIAVWTHSVPFGAPEVRARMFNADGTAATDEFVVIPQDTIGEGFAGHLASVTVLDDTIDAHPIPRFVVTWNDNTGKVFAQIFSTSRLELARDRLVRLRTRGNLHRTV